MNRESTAYHEAAHAVADARFGFVCGGVSINHDHRDHTEGRSHSIFGWHDEPSMRQWIVSLLAGYAAEIRLGTPEDVVRLGAAGDFEAAEELSQKFGLKDSIDDWIAKSALFVGDNWSAIQAVAAELLRSEELDYDEVAIIIEWIDGDNSESETVEQALESFRVLRGDISK